MLNYSKVATEKLRDVLKRFPDRPLVVYPFGERGKLVKSILNVYFGIDEVLIIDNKLASKYPNRIQNLDALRNKEFQNALVLITSDNPQFFSELREKLFTVFPKKQCVEVFSKIISEEQRKKQREMEIRKSQFQYKMQTLPKVYEKMDACHPLEYCMCYHPKKTHSLFFLPFVFMDFIQQTLFLTDDYFEIKNLRYVFDEFHDGEIKQVVKNGTVIDIGANIGNHTLFFANELHVGKVIAFEPIYETFNILQKNIEINHLEKKVELYRCALGHNKTSAVMHGYNYSNIGGTGLTVCGSDVQYNEEENIVVHSLDSMNISEHIALMKIDVEGMEIDVLKGARATIKRYKPFIIIESFENNFPKVKSLLERIGYNWKQIAFADYLFFPNV